MIQRRAGRRIGERGFSLMELAVGIAVLVGGLMGLAASMISAYKVDRLSRERKTALAFGASTIEYIRNLGPSGCEQAPPNGFLRATAGSGDDGVRKDLNNGGDTKDYFVRYYYPYQGRDPVTLLDNPALGKWYPSIGTAGAYRLDDALLEGLTPQPGQTRVAEITFCDPDGATGIGEGEGYWVTVRVFWKGISGEAELRMSSFIAR